jgi:hypothetical protein
MKTYPIIIFCQGLGKVLERSWKGLEKVLERSWKGLGKVLERSWKGLGKVLERSETSQMDLKNFKNSSAAYHNFYFRF